MIRVNGRGLGEVTLGNESALRLQRTINAYFAKHRPFESAVESMLRNAAVGKTIKVDGIIGPKTFTAMSACFIDAATRTGKSIEYPGSVAQLKARVSQTASQIAQLGDVTVPKTTGGGGSSKDPIHVDPTLVELPGAGRTGGMSTAAKAGLGVGAVALLLIATSGKKKKKSKRV